MILREALCLDVQGGMLAYSTSTPRMAERAVTRMIPSIRRFVAMGLAAASMLTVSATDAAPPRHAAFLVDANTREVLYANAADELRHPASLTKMMTLYLVFDALESGRLKIT